MKINGVSGEIIAVDECFLVDRKPVESNLRAIQECSFILMSFGNRENEKDITDKVEIIETKFLGDGK